MKHIKNQKQPQPPIILKNDKSVMVLNDPHNDVDLFYFPSEFINIQIFEDVTQISVEKGDFGFSKVTGKNMEKNFLRSYNEVIYGYDDDDEDDEDEDEEKEDKNGKYEYHK